MVEAFLISDDLDGHRLVGLVVKTLKPQENQTHVISPGFWSHTHTHTHTHTP